MDIQAHRPLDHCNLTDMIGCFSCFAFAVCVSLPGAHVCLFCGVFVVVLGEEEPDLAGDVLPRVQQAHRAALLHPPHQVGRGEIEIEI